MAWTAPITFVAGAVLTTANITTYLRDNMLMMAPAIGTTIGDYFVSDAANSLVRRLPAVNVAAASVNTVSTAFVALAGGPAITVTTGTRCMLVFAALFANDTLNAGALASYAISGATTTAAGDSVSIALDGITAANAVRLANANFETILTAGSNTFTMQYRATSNTATFQDRMIAALPF